MRIFLLTGSSTASAAAAASSSSFAFLPRRGVEILAFFGGGGGGVTCGPRALDRVLRPPSVEPPRAFTKFSLSAKARSVLVNFLFDGVFGDD